MGAQEELEAAMMEEQSKGASSSAPEDTLAGISLSKDILSGTEPFNRDTFAQAISGELGEIKQRKADLYKKIQDGSSLTSSQTVGLGILALGLLAAGGITKGKRGIAAAGDAFNVGGQVFLKQNERKQEATEAAAKSEISALNSQENSLTKQGIENRMAPIKTEESIGAKLEARRRAVKEGLVKPGGATINVNTGLASGELPSSVQAELIKTQGSIDVGEQIAEKLQKLPGDFQGTLENQINKRFSATERGQLESKLLMYKRMLQSAIEGKRGSDQDNAIFSQIVSGDFTASGPVQAGLIRQANEALKRITLTEIETYQKLRTPEGVEDFKKSLQPKAASGTTVKLKDGTTRQVTSKQEALKLREEGLL